MTVEFATSTSNPSFRIYRIAGGGPNWSLVSENSIRAGEELIIFAGDEERTTHYDTERRLSKLSKAGRSVALDLFRLPLTGLYVAVDQLQLTCRDRRGWNNPLHEEVLGILYGVFGRDIAVIEVPWRAILSPPTED